MEQSKSINPFNTGVVTERRTGMSVFPQMLSDQAKGEGAVVVFDVGLSSRSFFDLMRDGRKVNSRAMSVGKNEPYFRQYDKRK